MTKILSKLYKIGESITLVVQNDSGVSTKIVNSSHAQWKGIVEAYRLKDWDKLVALMDVRGAISANSQGRFTVKGESVYFNGEVVGGYLFDKIISNLEEGFEFDSLLLLADELWKNPSNKARQSFYRWAESRNFTVTDKGTVIGWKYLANDYFSVHGNPAIKPIQGKTDAEGRIYNGVGETIELDRGDVNDNEVECATNGLHIASKAFAVQNKPHDGHIVLCEFSPKDVVVCPNESGFAKLRVAKYYVLAEETDGLDNTEDNSYTKALPKRDANGRFCKQ